MPRTRPVSYTHLDVYKRQVVASALPGEVAGTLVQGVGALMGRLPDYNGRRAVAASHMARVLGRPLAPREQRRMVAEVFANYGRYWAESLRLPSRTKAEILDLSLIHI